MRAATDQRLTDALTMPMQDIAARLELANLRRVSDELVGPCPKCGGRDRFSISTTKNLFNCRICAVGGDQVALVRHILGMDFKAALEWLCGPAHGLSDAEREERRKRAEASRRKQDEIANRAREGSVRAARKIWFDSAPADGSPVRAYLTLRGIHPTLYPALPAVLRFHPEARYVVPVDGKSHEWQTLHVGPAMIAAVVDGGNRVTAVHRTWIDLSQPKGKLVLPDPRKPGETLPAKKVLGSKKGGAIRFLTPQGCDTMIMAEGVETTLSALIAEALPKRCAYWCGIDLGNMAGRMQRGPGLKYAGLPDFEDADAWLPPLWVKRLIFVQDGDSDPKLTRAKLQAGLRRAKFKRPGLRGYIVHAGDGRDLNDILMGQNDD